MFFAHFSISILSEMIQRNRFFKFGEYLTEIQLDTPQHRLMSIKINVFPLLGDVPQCPYSERVSNSIWERYFLQSECSVSTRGSVRGWKVETPYLDRQKWKSALSRERKITRYRFTYVDTLLYSRHK
jgi:hypothetical protein